MPKIYEKGMPIYIEGSLSISQYEDKEGIKRKYTEILANDINFLPNYKFAQSEKTC